MFGDILVPLDGSTSAEQALQIAVPLCRYLDSRLVVVAYADIKHLSETHSSVLLALANAGVDDLDTDVTVETASKSVAGMITDRLQSVPGTLLCMSTHGHGRSQLFTGSVANTVLQDTSSPVLLIGPHCEPMQFEIGGPVIVAVDGSEHSEAIVPVATAWAIVSQSPVEIVSVIDTKALMAVSASHGDLNEAAYVQRIAAAVDLDVSTKVGFETLHGSHPAKSIVDHVGFHTASVIAMATHGATGLARVTAGSVTAEVIRSSHVPVLVIRPPQLDN